MTIAHEIGHFVLLCIFGVRLYSSTDETIHSCCDPEWQAKCFTGEFLINKDLVKNFTSYDIYDKCGVSIEAAEYQLSKFREE